MVNHDKAGVLFLDRPRRREAAGHPCAGLAEKETAWTVPRPFSISSTDGQARRAEASQANDADEEELFAAFSINFLNQRG
jgi:hypothetical protein